MPARRHLLCITLAALIAFSFSAAGATEIFTTACADFATNFGSHCGGAYSSTTTSDNSRECLQEGLQGTKSRLNHIWKFCNVPAGTLSLVYEGYRPDNPDGDNFLFAYNTTGQSFGLVITGATIDSESELPPATVPLNWTSTAPTDIYLIIYDTLATGTDLATVQLDYLAIKTVTQAPADVCASSDYSTGPGIITSGSYASTCVSDDVREVFQETIQSGKSKLRHKWQFLNVPAGSSHELVVEGFRPDNGDGENFAFAYNTNCTQSFGLTLDCLIDSPSETTVTCSFGGSVSGTICVHFYDTVAAGNDLDTVQIDKVVIRTIP